MIWNLKKTKIYRMNPTINALTILLGWVVGPTQKESSSSSWASGRDTKTRFVSFATVVKELRWPNLPIAILAASLGEVRSAGLTGSSWPVAASITEEPTETRMEGEG